MPPLLALVRSRIIGPVVHDIVLTRDEIAELMAALLVSAEPATCPTPFSDWLETQANTIGRRHSSELAPNYPPHI